MHFDPNESSSVTYFFQSDIGLDRTQFLYVHATVSSTEPSVKPVFGRKARRTAKARRG